MTRRLVLSVLALAVASTACAQTFAAGAAVVNGVSISQAELDRQVDAQLNNPQSGLGGGQAARLDAERQVLVGLIQQELLSQEADRRGIVVDDAEIDQRIDSLRGQTPEADFLSRVEQAGFTMESLRAQIRLQIALTQIQDSLVQPVSDDQVRDVYNLSKDQFRQVKVRHILFRVDQGGNDAKALKRARATYVELQGGASFAALAKKRSQDQGSASLGGRLPGWTSLAQLDQGFAQAAATAKIGVVTEPVRSQFGYHLILVEARRVQPLAQVRAQVKQQLEQQSSDAAIRSFLGELAAGADIVVNPRIGDWNGDQGQIVPHESFVPADNETDPNPPPVGIPSGLVVPQ